MGIVCYNGDPLASQNSTNFQKYEEGFTTGSYGLAEYFVSMSIASFMVEKFKVVFCSQIVHALLKIIRYTTKQQKLHNSSISSKVKNIVPKIENHT